jgi:uncharacterized membrane protein
MAKKVNENIKRSITKAITFRLLIVLSDAVIVLALTHKVALTLGVVVLSNIASTTFYFLHERLWNVIGWGKEMTEESAK